MQVAYAHGVGESSFPSLTRITERDTSKKLKITTYIRHTQKQSFCDNL